MIILGTVLLILSCLMAVPSTNLLPLAIALFLLGLGWNFAYVAGSTLLADQLSPEERAKTQGFNDLLLGLARPAELRQRSDFREQWLRSIGTHSGIGDARAAGVGLWWHMRGAWPRPSLKTSSIVCLRMASKFYLCLLAGVFSAFNYSITQ